MSGKVLTPGENLKQKESHESKTYKKTPKENIPTGLLSQKV